VNRGIDPQWRCEVKNSDEKLLKEGRNALREETVCLSVCTNTNEHTHTHTQSSSTNAHELPHIPTVDYTELERVSWY
jgi:hypothetical protein